MPGQIPNVINNKESNPIYQVIYFMKDVLNKYHDRTIKKISDIAENRMGFQILCLILDSIDDYDGTILDKNSLGP